MSPKLACVNQALCVACGCCAKVCPMAAISVYKGLYARINEETCVGCGKCSAICPADLITIMKREVAK